MGFVSGSMAMAYTFLYGMSFPSKWEISIIALAVYALHLAISGCIMFASLKVAGVSIDILTGFSKALFTIFARDLIALPLILLTAFFPIIGILISLILWLGIIKFVFQISWLHAALVFIISLILPFVILLFILIPIALLFI